MQLILFFISSWRNSSYSSISPGKIYSILHSNLMQLILLFILSWCNSSYSLYRPGATHPILHIVLVQLILTQIVLVQIARAARNEINSAPQAAVTVFAFSYVVILLYAHMAVMLRQIKIPEFSAWFGLAIMQESINPCQRRHSQS